MDRKLSTVLFFVFSYLISSFAVQADVKTVRDEDYFPFPWSNKCTLDFKSLEGLWTINSTYNPKTGETTGIDLSEGFRFSSVKTDLITQETIFKIEKFDLNKQENSERKTHEGYGFMSPDGMASVIMSKVEAEGDSTDLSAWILSYSYVISDESKDINQNQICTSQWAKKAIAIMPKYPLPEGGIHLIIEPQQE